MYKYTRKNIGFFQMTAKLSEFPNINFELTLLKLLKVSNCVSSQKQTEFLYTIIFARNTTCKLFNSAYVIAAFCLFVLRRSNLTWTTRL